MLVHVEVFWLRSFQSEYNKFDFVLGLIYAKTKSKMRKIEHIGIAVNSLELSNLLFKKLFGNAPYKQEEVTSEGVKTSFFRNGPNKIELLEATNPESPIAKFIEKKGDIRKGGSLSLNILDNEYYDDEFE